MICFERKTDEESEIEGDEEDKNSILIKEVLKSEALMKK